MAAVHSKPPLHIKSLVKEIAPKYGVDPDQALAIMWCESRYVVRAKNHNDNGTNDVGLFQINDVHIPRLVSLGLTRYDARENITYAMMLMKANGTSDWNASAHCWRPLA